jgi:hypothetical protein
MKKDKCTLSRRGHEGLQEEYGYSSTLSLTSALDGQSYSLAALPPKKDPVPILQDARPCDILKLIQSLKLRMPVALMVFQTQPSGTFQEDL